MTGSTTFEGDVTIETIEWRSHDVMARAGKAIVKSQLAQNAQLQVAKFSHRAEQRIAYLVILVSVRKISELMQSLLDLLHSADCIRVLEAATPEQLTQLSQSMSELHGKIERFDLMIRPTRYWKSWFRTELAKILCQNEQIASHVEAFSSVETQLLLLTRNDQDQLLKALSKPETAAAKLRRAFAQKI
jgi:hypothetical protein